MSIHVLIKRKWQVNDSDKLFPLLHKLRTLAQNQPGFLSKQTLRNIADQESILVVSRWETLDDWNEWLQSDKRREIQASIDSLIGEKTFYELYEVVDDKGVALAGRR